MEWEELQRAWDSIESEPKSHDELRGMMYATSFQRRLRGLFRDEIIGLSLTGLIFVTSIIFCYAFGDWSSVTVLILAIMQVIDRYLGLNYLRFVPEKPKIRETWLNALVLIRRRSTISHILNGLIWVVLAFSLKMNVHVVMLKTSQWMMILLPLIWALVSWSFDKWSKERRAVVEFLNGLHHGVDEEGEMD